MKIFLNKITFENILKFISINIAVIYILFLFWNRVFRIRLPKNLDNNYSEIHVIIFTFLFLSCIFFLCFSIHKVISKMYLKKKGKLSYYLSYIMETKISKFLIEYLINAPKHLYELFYQYITFRPLIEKFGIIVWNMDPYYYCKAILFIVYSLRIFVCIIFIIDIMYFKSFNYFYKSLIILLIPLIIKTSLYIIQDMSKKNKAYIEEEFLIIEVNETKDGYNTNPQKNIKIV